MIPELLNPAHLPDPRPNGYSTAAVVPAGGRIAFVSGQGGQQADGSLSPDFAAQVRQAYANLAAVLAAIGAGPAQVVKITTYVVGHTPDRLGPLTAGVVAMFGDRLPAQTLVGVAALAVPPMLFEVEAVVLLP
jgi:enamine deaminase RidA (YjgF/YER057c/UK114 family)